MKCKLFVLSLHEGATTGFKNLKPHSISSWGKLCEKFRSHFTTSRLQSKFVDSLGAIQNPGEPLRDYIERFNKEAIQVQSMNKEMKMHLLRKWLISNTKFVERLSKKKKFVEHINLEKPKDFNHPLEKPEKYKQYQEMQKDNKEMMTRNEKHNKKTPQKKVGKIMRKVQ